MILHSNFLLLLPSLAAITALAGPTSLSSYTSPLEKRYQEGSTWILTNLTYIPISSFSNSSVSFLFTDPSPDIAMNTTCSANLTASNDGEETLDAQPCYPCEGYTTLEGSSTGFGVSFRFNGTAIGVNRTYDDSSINPPYLELATASGHTAIQDYNVSFAKDHGEMDTVDYLEVPVIKVA